jgi:hypothetical protein
MMFNEQFSGGWVPDYTGENWGTVPTPAPYYVSLTVWADNVGVWDTGSAPTAPAMCGIPAVLCLPQFRNPGVGPHTLVQHVPQSWFIGSPVSGSGARVQTNTLQKYTDSGWHTDIVTPKP